MSSKTTTKWTGGMTFDSEINGHHVIMDADLEWGGQDKGPRPKPLLLASLSGCSGMDIVSILDKMRVKDYELRIDGEADSTTDQPVVYHTIRLSFFFYGKDLPLDKIIKAVMLSLERYCGVNAMLKRSSNIVVKTFINDIEVNN